MWAFFENRVKCMSSSTIIPWVVGNWKMNPMQANSQQLIQDLKQQLKQNPISEQQCRIGIAPISIALLSVQQQLLDASCEILSVAQDLSRIAGTGAYTGEVSAELLKDSHIDYVLIGHSERREIFGDNVNVIQEKVKNALNAEMKIIYCVGESLEQREAGQAEQVVLQQICGACKCRTMEQYYYCL